MSWYVTFTLSWMKVNPAESADESYEKADVRTLIFEHVKARYLRLLDKKNLKIRERSLINISIWNH